MFIVILSSFAVPRVLRQRVLLIGVVGALVLRGIFIALGAGLISRFSWVFFIFGVILALTAVKVVRDAVTLTNKRQLEPLVLPDDIAKLPDLKGWLVYPQGFPAAGPSPARAKFRSPITVYCFWMNCRSFLARRWK